MLAYARQDANVLSKGTPSMGEEVEGTTKTILGRGVPKNAYVRQDATVLSGECPQGRRRPKYYKTCSMGRGYKNA